MSLHAARDTLIGLLAGFTNEPGAQERAEQESEDADHDWRCERFGRHEGPAHEDDEDDAQLEHQVGRGHLESHRGGEVSAFAKDRPGKGHSRIRAGGGNRPERERDPDRAWTVVGQQTAHLPTRDDRLNDGGQRKAENERPQDFPSHRDRYSESVHQRQ